MNKEGWTKKDAFPAWCKHVPVLLHFRPEPHKSNLRVGTQEDLSVLRDLEDSESLDFFIWCDIHCVEQIDAFLD